MEARRLKAHSPRAALLLEDLAEKRRARFWQRAPRSQDDRQAVGAGS